MLLKNISTDHLSIQHWEIKPDECWAVLGRNGSGKNILGQLIVGAIKPDSGDYEAPAGNINIVSFESQQELYELELKSDDTDFIDHIDPGTTVRELLDLKDTVPDELKFLGLSDILDRGYRLLSSGEGRKTLLAQALLQKPDFLVLDEPYDSLDIPSRKELSNYFEKLLAEKTLQLLFLLNSQEEISPWHTHLAIMEKGEIIAQGKRQDILDNPEITALLNFNPATLPDWPEGLSIDSLPEVLVSLKNGKVNYGDTIIFKELELEIKPGQHTLITGRNGSGKSTLLNIISGDHPQCYGNELIVMNYKRGSGESIWQIKKQMGLASPGLHRDHRVAGSALHICVSGFFDSIGLYDQPSQIQSKHAQQWLALVGLEEKISIPFKQLSYGEQRLVLIARALVKQPALLLLDEPTQGLDDVNRHRLMYFLEHLSSQHQTTIVMASHRLDEQLPLFINHIEL